MTCLTKVTTPKTSSIQHATPRTIDFWYARFVVRVERRRSSHRARDDNRVRLAIYIVLTISLFVVSQDAKTPGSIHAADFPLLAGKVPFFEKRSNSKDPRIREEAIRSISYAMVGPDARDETTRLFKRLLRDSDPQLRGLAIYAMHHEWIVILPKELPRTFRGYHRDQVVDLDEKDLIPRLIKECEGGGPAGGYAAYVLCLVPSKGAIPALRRLGMDQNIFARYTAARALVHAGDHEGAKAILEPIIAETTPVGFRVRGLDPHYVALACRTYMGLGQAERLKGLSRLVSLMELLDDSPDINDHNRLQFLRWHLTAVSGEFFETPREARAWLKEKAK